MKGVMTSAESKQPGLEFLLIISMYVYSMCTVLHGSRTRVKSAIFAFAKPNPKSSRRRESTNVAEIDEHPLAPLVQKEIQN